MLTKAVNLPCFIFFTLNQGFFGSMSKKQADLESEHTTLPTVIGGPNVIDRKREGNFYLMTFFKPFLKAFSVFNMSQPLLVSHMVVIKVFMKLPPPLPQLQTHLYPEVA